MHSAISKFEPFPIPTVLRTLLKGFAWTMVAFVGAPAVFAQLSTEEEPAAPGPLILESANSSGEFTPDPDSTTIVESDPIQLFTGDSFRLVTQETTRVAIANPEVAEAVVLSPKELLILGVGTGNTTLSVWQADGLHQYRIIVSDPSTKQVKEVLEAMGLHGVQVQLVGSSLILDGQVATELEHQNALKIATAFREGTIDLISVSDPIQVRIDILVAEVSRDSGKEVGLDWNNSVTWAGDFFYQRIKNHTREPREITRDSTLSFGHGLSSGEGTFDTVDNSITAVLNLLVQNGDARILAQPRLTTLSGKEANFLAGGEIPIVREGLNSFQVEYRSYGVQLTVNPIVDAQRMIEMQLTPEVSGVDFGTSAGGMPGFKTRRASTYLSAEDGETIVIGGLLSSEQVESIQKVPILGSIPILGHLFRSTRFRNNETELLFFVTPHLIQKDVGREWATDERLDTIPQTMEEMKNLRDRHFTFDPEARSDIWLLEDAQQLPEQEPASATHSSEATQTDPVDKETPSEVDTTTPSDSVSP
jgi:pilus assembly protein CpaC